MRAAAKPLSTSGDVVAVPSGKCSPSYSPELNSIENAWQYLRQNSTTARTLIPSAVRLGYPYHKGTPILLAKSPEHNLRGKICSRHGAKLDENRTSILTNSTIMHSFRS